jgi:hypothetical protein
MRDMLSEPAFRDYINPTDFSCLPFYSEESYSNSSLVPLLMFGSYDRDLEIDNVDESYTSIKFLNYLHHMNYVNSIGCYNNGTQPFSYIQVLNAFRSRAEETINTIDNEDYADFDNSVAISENNEFRSMNYLKLRSTAKNAIKTFNAFQKVFKFRFDDGRANVHFNDFATLSVKVPFLSENRVKYESLLGKNRESFFSTTNYKPVLTSSYTSIAPILNSMNIYFGNIPFLLSMHSDPSRFM